MSTKTAPRVQELKIEMNRIGEEIKSLFDKAGDNVDDPEHRDAIKGLMQKEDECAKELIDLTEGAALKSAWDDRQRSRREVDVTLPHHRGGVEVKTLGEAFVSDPAVKAWREDITKRGHVSDRERVQSPAFEVKGGLKALVTGASATSAGALIVEDRKPILDMGTFYRPDVGRVRNLLTQGTTNGDTIEFVRQGAHTNAAAAVAESTAVSGSSGVKPESSLVLEVVSTTVKTIAHWLAATRQSLSDAGQIRTLIESFLRYGLEDVIEDQILNGTAAAGGLVGIFETTGTSTQAFDTDLLKTHRLARTKVRTDGRSIPTAYVLNPLDWQEIDLLKDNEARYYYGGPSAMGTPRLWGLPVVESEAMDENRSMVADWRLAVLWDREQANILVTDSHSDFFIRNLIAILAEARVALGVIRPKAFVEIAHS